MNKPKIVFLCHFSNQLVRNNLDLESFRIRKWVYEMLGKDNSFYSDYAIWISDYILGFEKYIDRYETHIVSPHIGLIKVFQEFQYKGISYHFYRPQTGILTSLLNIIFNYVEKTHNALDRKRIKKIISSINPDVVCMCGAENPDYSFGVLDIKDKPIYVILQTFLNDLKRIKMNVGNTYRREGELRIFKHANYFCTEDVSAIKYIKVVNPNAFVMPVRFPTHRPCIKDISEKEFDYVFFSKQITPNKGIEDVLKAFSIVLKRHPNRSLNVIGGCTSTYMTQLHNIIHQNEIENKVVFSGYYEKIEDTYYNVKKARVVVLPGITASLNSTVRESMFMGLPTICYEDAAIVQINKDKHCLLSAPMGDVEGLAEQMIFTIESPEMALEIGKNGQEYAERVFGNDTIVSKLLENLVYIIDHYYNHQSLPKDRLC